MDPASLCVQAKGRPKDDVESDTVIFGPGGAEAETATIEGDRFVFPDGFVSTPAG